MAAMKGLCRQRRQPQGSAWAMGLLAIRPLGQTKPRSKMAGRRRWKRGILEVAWMALQDQDMGGRIEIRSLEPPQKPPIGRIMAAYMALCRTRILHGTGTMPLRQGCRMGMAPTHFLPTHSTDMLTAPKRMDPSQYSTPPATPFRPCSPPFLTSQRQQRISMVWPTIEGKPGAGQRPAA